MIRPRHLQSSIVARRVSASAFSHSLDPKPKLRAGSANSCRRRFHSCVGADSASSVSPGRLGARQSAATDLGAQRPPVLARGRDSDGRRQRLLRNRAAVPSRGVSGCPNATEGPSAHLDPARDHAHQRARLRARQVAPALRYDTIETCRDSAPIARQRTGACCAMAGQPPLVRRPLLAGRYAPNFTRPTQGGIVRTLSKSAR